MTDWKELPPGHDVTLTQGYLFAFLARVKNNHTKDDILALAKTRGFRVDDYREMGAAGGNYRNIAVMGLETGSNGGTVPWSSPVTLIDETSLTKAWAAPATSGAPELPPGAISSSSNTGIVLASLAAAAGVGYLLWRRYGRRRK